MQVYAAPCPDSSVVHNSLTPTTTDVVILTHYIEWKENCSLGFVFMFKHEKTA